MQFVSPDVLQEARGLSTAMTSTLLVLGVALWVFGWRWHRFWVVSGVTLAAGLLGLQAGRATGETQTLAIGILLAVTAGLLALELARLVAFLGGGCGAWLAVQWVVPQAQELWAVFLSGGLFGVLLYRLWTMLLTSLAGVLLTTHAGLVLLEQGVIVEASQLVEHHQAAANGFVVGMVVLGIVLQALTSSESSPVKKDQDKPKIHKKTAVEDEEPHPDLHTTSSPWWRRLFGGRKAA
jgi:hypothetical protein